MNADTLKTVKRYIFVMVPTDGYAQNTELDQLLGLGFRAVYKIAQEIMRWYQRSPQNYGKCNVFSFGCNAFKEAASIITAPLGDYWSSEYYPYYELPVTLSHCGTKKDQYVALLDHQSEEDGQIFFDYLFDGRTKGVDTVIIVTSHTAVKKLAGYLCNTLGIRGCDNRCLNDDSFTSGFVEVVTSVNTLSYTPVFA